MNQSHIYLEFEIHSNLKISITFFSKQFNSIHFIHKKDNNVFTLLMFIIKKDRRGRNPFKKRKKKRNQLKDTLKNENVKV